MKTLVPLGACVAFAVLLVAATSLSAPSLPVLKPPLQPLPSYSGPGPDPHAVSGQWFRVIASGVITARSHQFHDNAAGHGGGASGSLAISGYVVNVVKGPINSPISSFDILATIVNDSPSGDIWQNGTNSLGEARPISPQATGTLTRAILTANFALLDPSDQPVYEAPFASSSGNPIVAGNMDMAAWYGPTPGSGTAPDGAFFVPAWDFGDLASGASSSRLLQFTVAGALSVTDPRYGMIMDSYLNGTDLFFSRSAALKIGSWVAGLAADNGEADPESMLFPGDVSVFHDTDGPVPLEFPAATAGLGPTWAQPPDHIHGLDVTSWGWGDVPVPWHPVCQVADDWLSDGRPVNGLRWWGSYAGWQDHTSAPDQPPPAGLLHPTAFLVGWYETAPPTLPQVPFSRPGSAIRWDVYPLQWDTGGQKTSGVVWERAAGMSPLVDGKPALVEHEYVYDLAFPVTRTWNPRSDRTYWLSIQALYDEAPATNAWGWHTTTPEHNWNAAAVFIDPVGTPHAMVYPPPGWESDSALPYAGQSVNQAFELLSDVLPRRVRKWAQPPDLLQGDDRPSFMIQGDEATGLPVRADDWRCDGRRVCDIRWWGSYLDYRSAEPGPVPPPADAALRPIGFNLSWYADESIEGGSHVPGLLLTNLVVSVSNCHEVYYGPVAQSWRGEGVFSHEFQYAVNLLNPALAAPWLEATGLVCWLSVQAVFPVGFIPGGTNEDAHAGWGWATTSPERRWNTASAVTSNGLPWKAGTYPPGHPFFPQSCDLALELTTDQIGEGTDEWSQPVTITEIRRAASGALRLSSVGDRGAGMQVLQACDAFPGSNWVSLATNALPHPGPYANVWTDTLTAGTVRVYRIIQQ